MFYSFILAMVHWSEVKLFMLLKYLQLFFLSKSLKTFVLVVLTGYIYIILESYHRINHYLRRIQD